MKFFANKLNGNYLRNVLPGSDIEVDWVRAAIAYGSDSTTLIEDCLRRRLRLDIWMRYDHTVPVAPSLLRLLLRSTRQSIFCSLIPDVLHAKVIWWKNYGAYIGSANLTDRAWVSNIEFGVFLPESTLEAHGGMIEVEEFFEYLMTCEEAIQLDDAVVEEQERLWRLRNSRLHALERDSKRERSINEWDGPASTPERRRDKQKDNFVKEWRNGLRILKSIAEDAPQYRPKWLKEDVPASWQADQFLHAYYYNKVVVGARHPYEEHYQRNRGNPTAATNAAFEWWAKLEQPPSEEDINCHERAPSIRSLLSPSSIALLSLEGFKNICLATHATVDHVRRLSHEDLGLPSSDFNVQDRLEAFAQSIWSKKNSRGEGVSDLLRFVLDGGPADEIPSRLFEAAKRIGRKLPHLGPNQLAEIAGWARPELCPPRNGRTSKSLRALGFDVRVY